jgi:Ala-tRNA(Pro) deacylase
LAKTVIVKLDGSLAMAVLPASFQVDLQQLQAGTGAKTIALATEGEFRARFPGCETGAMPPFGFMYEMPVYVDKRMSQDTEIAFNAGSHNELIRMSWTDFERLAQPKMLDFAAARNKTHAA